MIGMEGRGSGTRKTVNHNIRRDVMGTKNVKLHVDECLFKVEENSSLGAGKSKEDRYNWSCVNAPGELKYIDKNSLYVDREYQRDFSDTRIMEIAKDFSWPKFGVITVFQRESNGKYVVADGQHRYIAAMKRADVSKLPCIVFKSASKAVEAEAFIDINTGSKAVSAIAKFKAGICAKNPDYLAVQEIFAKNALNPYGGRKKRSVRCIGVFVNLVKTVGFDVTNEIAFAATQANANEDISDRFIKALAYMRGKLGQIPDAMIQDIKRVGHTRITQSIRDMSVELGKGGDRTYASGLCCALNHAKRGGSKRWSVE
jgi:hypothetical protein